jgi:predicted ribosomally synthesized peptide with SipW-like signal peptide
LKQEKEMTFENAPAQVVVIEERKRRKGLAWLAGGAALAMLLSGGTFALWRASAAFTGGQVTAGDLDLTGCKGDKLQWYDVSPDRHDSSIADITVNGALFTGLGSKVNTAAQPKSVYTAGNYPTAYTNYAVDGNKIAGHPITAIDGSDPHWRMVPGDTVIGVCEDALATLEGDNMVAALKLMKDDGEGEFSAFNFAALNAAHVGVVVVPQVFMAGVDVTPSTVTDSLGYFGAPHAGQQAGVDPEGNGVVRNLAATADDLRTATENDGRGSLGQERISIIFTVHFIDDGIDDYEPGTGTSAATCGTPGLGWTADAATHTASNCTSGFVAAHTGDGDASNPANNRYLAQQELADIASGKLMLEQVRTGAGLFTTAP